MSGWSYLYGSLQLTISSFSLVSTKRSRFWVFKSCFMFYVFFCVHVWLPLYCCWHQFCSAPLPSKRTNTWRPRGPTVNHIEQWKVLPSSEHIHFAELDLFWHLLWRSITQLSQLWNGHLLEILFYSCSCG